MDSAYVSKKNTHTHKLAEFYIRVIKTCNHEHKISLKPYLCTESLVILAASLEDWSTLSFKLLNPPKGMMVAAAAGIPSSCRSL